MSDPYPDTSEVGDPYPYTTEEFKLRSRKHGGLVPQQVWMLKAIADKDLREIIRILAEEANERVDSVWVDSRNDFADIQEALAYSADLLSSAKTAEKPADWVCKFCGTYLFSLSAISIKNESRSSSDPLGLFYRKQIQSCMIVLIALGKVSEAVEMAYFASAVAAITANPVDLRKGCYHHVRPSLAKLKILLTLIDYLESGLVPTKKALHIGFQKSGSSISSSRFSKLLNQLEVGPNIRDEGTRTNKDEGTFFPFDTLAQQYSKTTPLGKAMAEAAQRAIKSLNDSKMSGPKC